VRGLDPINMWRMVALRYTVAAPADAGGVLERSGHVQGAHPLPPHRVVKQRPKRFARVRMLVLAIAALAAAVPMRVVGQAGSGPHLTVRT